MYFQSEVNILTGRKLKKQVTRSSAAFEDKQKVDLFFFIVLQKGQTLKLFMDLLWWAHEIELNGKYHTRNSKKPCETGSRRQLPAFTV